MFKNWQQTKNDNAHHPHTGGQTPTMPGGVGEEHPHLKPRIAPYRTLPPPPRGNLGSGAKNQSATAKEAVSKGENQAFVTAYFGGGGSHH